MPTHTPQQGTKFYYSTDGTSYTEITEMKSVEVPGQERDGSDDTVLSSTLEVSSAGVLSKITQGKFTVFRHQTIWATLEGHFDTGTNLYWRVTYPLIDSQATNMKTEWRGWIKKISAPKSEVGSEKLMGEMEIERTTKPTTTAGS